MIYRIRKILEKVAGKEVGQVFISERPEFGDYSTNAAFLLSKELKRPPLEIAKELAVKIEQEERGKRKEERIFSKVEAAPPGFVNFWLSANALKQELIKILKTEKFLVPGSKFKVNIEFISANPTGPLTIANGRGGFLGDVIANVLENVGIKVVREYYINDAGNQIKLLGESILAALGKLPSKEEHYKGEYIKILGHRMSKKLRNVRTSDVRDIENFGRSAAKELLKQIKQSLKKAGIKFDKFYSEHENLRGEKGLIKEVLKILEKNGLVAEHDGAKWLKTSDIAEEKDRVLVKSNGEPTYFLADVAYHYDKFIKRKFDKAIDIWGADHHGYAARMEAGIKALGIEPGRMEIIITQLVRLVRGGKEVKMSKRKGEFVTLDELIRETGGDAARFFFLMNTPDTHMDFDLELAKERSLKNPVYYVQYAFVRCSSILRKVKSKKLKVKSLALLSSESELNLMKELVKLPDTVKQTAEDYNVSRLARYALEVARAFHNFYEKERVLPSPSFVKASKDTVEARLALVSAAKNILERLFGIMGISAPKKM